ncbi:DUF4336 domain-containing protein [Shewanella sp. UCD-KL12]|uniref:DUF4336 domain-containing protein n=1 Tax=Shewanella sp. UCD-KL12 TaxID=1917163 RepID=UPI000971402B|nr:DUF4336 domain-containing protein [Shewanella sp. UCD-KL12]
MTLALTQLGEDIWAYEDSMPLGGIQLRLRMTVVKLSCGGLWLHSPIKLTAELQSAIDNLGQVRFLVGPSNGHNIWLNEWKKAYPEAKMYVSAGIPKKIAISNYQLLDEHFDNIWSDDFERQYMPGVGFFNESVFYHKKSKSLLVTDLIQNHSDACPSGFAGVMTKCVFRPLGFKDLCIAPPLKMGFTIKDKPGFTQFIRNIKAWGFDKIVVTHGDVISHDAKAVFERLTQRFD